MTETYLRRALYFLGKQMTKSQRLSKQVGTVIGREPHRVRLLRVLLHRNGELITGRCLHRRHNTDEFFIRPLHQPQTDLFYSITQPSIPPGSVNEYQLQLGRQRQVGKAHLIGRWQNLGAVCFWQPLG